MIGTQTAAVWGAEGPFLLVYGALCLAALVAVGRAWRRAVGPEQPRRDPLPRLDVYRLAMLNGGPRLAITSAATRLLQDGLLESEGGKLKTTGKVDSASDPLERAVLEEVGRDSPLAVDALYAGLAGREPLRAISAQLIEAGLLVDPGRAATLRRLRRTAGLLAAVGVAWIVAGLAAGTAFHWRVAIAVGIVAAALMSAWRPSPATKRGQAILLRGRRDHDELRRHPAGGTAATATALFGGAALWLAAPEIASALGVARDDLLPWFASGLAAGNCGGGSWGGGGGCGGGGCGGGG